MFTTILFLFIGFLLPTLSGWLLLRIAEGRSPVLFPLERWIAGFVLGGTLITYLWFLAELSSLIRFTVWGMLAVQVLTTSVLAYLYWKRIHTTGTPLSLYTLYAAPSSPWTLWQKILLAIGSLWLLLRWIGGAILLFGPAYFDDTLKNWNLRGKAFYEMQELILEIEPGKGVGVGSYPPSVPLLKTWLAHIGGWNEMLINSMHILWLFSVLILIYFALRRILSQQWSLLGVYGTASLPLYAMHGYAAYADLFLSVHLFLAVVPLFHAARTSGAERLSYLKIGAIASGLLIFTKNEALLMHLPPILLLFCAVILIGNMQRTNLCTALLWYAGWIGSIGIPWLLFKWSNNLSFGNAKEIGAFDLTWHEGVLQSIAYNTFLEGNWIFLPLLFLGLLLLRHRSVLQSPLVLPVAFILIVVLGQLPIYMFTSLYTEAINQTGYARGLIHLVPLVILTTIIMLKDLRDHEQ